MFNDVKNLLTQDDTYVNKIAPALSRIFVRAIGMGKGIGLNLDNSLADSIGRISGVQFKDGANVGDKIGSLLESLLRKIENNLPRLETVLNDLSNRLGVMIEQTPQFLEKVVLPSLDKLVYGINIVYNILVVIKEVLSVGFYSVVSGFSQALAPVINSWSKILENVS